MVRRILIAAAIVLLVQGSAAAQPMSIRIASVYPPGGDIVPGTEAWISTLDRQLEGIGRVEWITTGQPLATLRTGVADLAVVPSGTLADAGAQALATFEIPFAFTDLREAAQLQQGGLGDAILASLGEGVIGLGYWNIGMRRVIGPPIRDVEKFKGLKLITLSSRDAQEAVRVLGAVPVTTSFNEIYQALQTGGADAAVASPAVILNNKWYETKRALLDTAFTPQVALVVASEAAWARFPFQVQAILAQAVRQRGANLTPQVLERESGSLAALRESGVEIQALSAEGLKSARQSVATALVSKRPQDDLVLVALTATDRQRSQRRPPAPPPERKSAGTRDPVMLFATARKRDPRQPPNFQFGGERGDLVYGALDLAFGPGGAAAKAANTDIKAVRPFADRKAFVAALGDQLKSDAKKPVLIYVHGFNNTFNEAVESASFLAADMKFPGVTIVFSWPSEGLAVRYPADEKEVRNSRISFVEFLGAVREAAGAHPVNLVTHSMGGRLIADALEWMAAQPGFKKPLLHHLIFATPDVDTTLFGQVLPSFAKTSDRVTLYASSADQALLCSQALHHGDRAGQAGDGIVVVKSLETVDASKVEPRSTWDQIVQLNPWYWLFFESCREGHSYITRNEKVLVDLNFLVIFDATPDQRRLDPRPWKQLQYWEFRHTN